jgi:hypothetical protein
VHSEANGRQAMEQRCRYVSRPAIVNERFALNCKVNVVVKLKTPWRNGATHIVLRPMACALNTLLL